MQTAIRTLHGEVGLVGHTAFGLWNDVVDMKDCGLADLHKSAIAAFGPVSVEYALRGRFRNGRQTHGLLCGWSATETICPNCAMRTSDSNSAFSVGVSDPSVFLSNNSCIRSVSSAES